jgi:putative transcriptional regulator
MTGKTKHDWPRADTITDEQIHAAALADPDAQPLTEERLARMKQTPRLKIIRGALGLTQEEFAARFQIPLGTLRDWEQGTAVPDQTAQAYLRAIAGDAAAVQRAPEAGSRHHSAVWAALYPHARTNIPAPARHVRHLPVRILPSQNA